MTLPRLARLAAVLLVTVVAVSIVVLKDSGNGAQTDSGVDAIPALQDVKSEADAGGTESQRRLPRLLELGSDTCIPCRMMAPILDELRVDFDGRLTVDFIDVRKDQTAATAYAITLIPTQIFFDRQGREVFRHTGFISREDILSEWERLGFDFDQVRAAGTAKDCWFEVIYLHPTVRCHDCLEAEANIGQAVADAFEDELAAGYLRWMVCDYEAPENQALGSLFEIDAGSELVLAFRCDNEIVAWQPLSGAVEIGQDADATSGWVVQAFQAFEQTCVSEPGPVDSEGG